MSLSRPHPRALLSLLHIVLLAALAAPAHAVPQQPVDRDQPDGADAAGPDAATPPAAPPTPTPSTPERTPAPQPSKNDEDSAKDNPDASPADANPNDLSADDLSDDDLSDDDLSDDDLAELEAALAADQATLADSRPAEPPSPATSPQQNLAAAAASLLPDMAFIVDVAAAWFSQQENLQTGAHDPPQTGFTLQQLELSLGKTVDPYFRVDGNIVFSQFGVEIEEIYATTLALPYSLQARAGQFLTRFGRINATHPHTWDFVDQTFVIGRVFGAEGNRGLGFELSYLTPLPWYVELVGSVTDAGGEASARSFFGSQSLPVRSPLDFQSTLAIKQFFALSHDWSLLWGLSAATGPNPTGYDNRSDVYGVDLYLKYRPTDGRSDTVISLQSEWLYRRRQIARDLLTDLSGYIYGLWAIDKRWSTGIRYEIGLPAENSTGERGADYLDPEWVETRHRLSAQVTYRPSEFSRIRAQAARDQPPSVGGDPIYALMLALEFNIGAHGAHAF